MNDQYVRQLDALFTTAHQRDDKAMFFCCLQSGVFLTERGQNIKRNTNVVYVSIDVGETWLPLHEFVNVSVGVVCRWHCNPIQVDLVYYNSLFSFDLFLMLITIAVPVTYVPCITYRHCNA